MSARSFLATLPTFELVLFRPGLTIPAELMELRMCHDFGTDRGQTLTVLGNAIEHLANSQRFDISEDGQTLDEETIHTLKRLRREIFEDLFNSSHSRQPQIWLIDRVLHMAC